MPNNLKPKKGNIFIYLILIAIVIGAMAALRHCINGSMDNNNAPDTSINIAIEYLAMTYSNLSKSVPTINSYSIQW